MPFNSTWKWLTRCHCHLPLCLSSDLRACPISTETCHAQWKSKYHSWKSPIRPPHALCKLCLRPSNILTVVPTAPPHSPMALLSCQQQAHQPTNHTLIFAFCHLHSVGGQSSKKYHDCSVVPAYVWVFRRPTPQDLFLCEKCPLWRTMGMSALFW